MKPQILALLQQGLQTLHPALPSALAEPLCAYLELLAKWNRAYNLTAVRDPREMIARHVLDSLAVSPYIYGEHLLDVGSGPGLPGLPLALARPDQRWVLLDSNSKKTRFITQAVLELGIGNVEAVTCRVEDYQPARQFDTVISRAYAELALFYRQTVRLCAPGGRLVAMKGQLSAEELEPARRLTGALETVALQVPGLEAQRHLVILRPPAALAAGNGLK